MENIGLKLKNLRLKNNLSVTEVENFLSESGITVSKKTIYKWEEGVNCPDIFTIKILLKIYHTTVTDFFNETNTKKIRLNTEEINFIEMIRYNQKYKQALITLFDNEILS